MDISVSGGSIQQIHVEQKKSGSEKQNKAATAKASFDNFKDYMPDGKLDSEVLRAVRQAEKLNLNLGKKLQFSVDRSSGQVLIKVVDASTDTVIKVLPPKELQRLGKRKAETGFLFDETA